MNPLLNDSKLDLEAIDFDKIKVEHYLPALDEAIKLAKNNFEKINSITDINFDSIILAGESASDRLDQIVEIFFSLHSAECTDELSDISEEFNKKLTDYSSDISLDPKIFAKVAEVYKIKDQLSLTSEQIIVLDQTYKSFTRNGALLSEDEKNTLRDLDQKASLLSLNFSENCRKATNAYELIIENEDDVLGMPDGILEAAAAKAKEVGKGKWVFTLDFPSYFPFMQHCPNRELRKEINEAATSKAVGGEFDNTQNVLDILKIRQSRAKLLGYADHPSFVLENRMAKKSSTVLSFLEEILEKATPKAAEDFARLKKHKEELTGEPDFRRWDSAMYTEKLQKKELDFDDEMIRPYFKLENVVDGVFTIAKKLYGLNFKERSDLPGYHKDVNVYEVSSEDGEYIGLFYTDFFPRKEKRSGAWMTTFRNTGFQFGEVKRPFVSIVCNFTKPTATKPSLLNLDEVLTLFHEFGHGLHGLLGKSKYKSVAGTNVFWDFVELPSQIMENWVLERECLDIFARHYETGAPMPDELVAKVKKSEQFLEGLGTLRQLSFGFLDMNWHSTDPDTIKDVVQFEKDSMSKFDLFPVEKTGAMSPSFSHIFSGGYAAGYYSYKWAEVLDADAFAYFKEKGIFNKEVATSFKENILERGGSEDPMELYIKFRGAKPTPEALLKRGGLI